MNIRRAYYRVARSLRPGSSTVRMPAESTAELLAAKTPLPAYTPLPADVRRSRAVTETLSAIAARELCDGYYAEFHVELGR